MIEEITDRSFLSPILSTEYVDNELNNNPFAHFIVYKNNGVWKLLCYVFLFSTIIYCTIDMILRVVYPNPYGNLFMLFANGLLYWCLCSIFPIIILVFGAKRILRL